MITELAFAPSFLSFSALPQLHALMGLFACSEQLPSGRDQIRRGPWQLRENGRLVLRRAVGHQHSLVDFLLLVVSVRSTRIDSGLWGASYTGACRASTLLLYALGLA